MKDDRRRVVVRDVRPQVDHGRHAIKRVPGEQVAVSADVFGDGHDEVAAVVQVRPRGRRSWRDTPMVPLGDGFDRWTATFTVEEPLGDQEYRVLGWIDHGASWQHALQKKARAGVDVPVQLQAGAALLRDMVAGAAGEDADRARQVADLLDDEDAPLEQRVALGLTEDTTALLRRVDPRWHATASERLPIQVDRHRARFSAWYELFPRSLGGPDRHGTLADVVDELPRIARMGFDVLYLPPIHPIGETHRKGADNTTTASPGDPGSPWAIGNADGGHLAVHSELGTVQDVAELARIARDEHGIDLALDIAFQCSPDHPWVTEHPEWFRHRPDGTIQYAENPPKKYQDIYPLDFETEDAAGLWQALLEVFLHWCDRGVRVFRVDNPHTKSFPFWDWCIAELRAAHPDVILLAEAFTRPRVMEELAKRGFAQSYSYFTWREHRWELEQYVREMFHSQHIDFMRPNFWPNTPDILPAHLEHGTRATFVARLVLASMLNANYGVYGPPYELLEQAAIIPGRSGDYLHSEKYQLRHRELPDPDEPGTMSNLMKRVNEIRNAHPALQGNRNLTQHHVDDDQLMAWSKAYDGGVAPDGTRLDPDVVLVVVNLDPHHGRAGTVHLDLGGLRLREGDVFTVHDELSDRTFRWRGSANYVELGTDLPAHVFDVRGPDGGQW